MTAHFSEKNQERCQIETPNTKIHDFSKKSQKETNLISLTNKYTTLHFPGYIYIYTAISNVLCATIIYNIYYFLVRLLISTIYIYNVYNKKNFLHLYLHFLTSVIQILLWYCINLQLDEINIFHIFKQYIFIFITQTFT